MSSEVAQCSIEHSLCFSIYQGAEPAASAITNKMLEVVLDGRLVHSGAQVSAEPGGYIAVTDPSGAYTAGPPPPGTYTVDVRMGSYLRAGRRDL